MACHSGLVPRHAGVLAQGQVPARVDESGPPGERTARQTGGEEPAGGHPVAEAPAAEPGGDVDSPGAGARRTHAGQPVGRVDVLRRPPPDVRRLREPRQTGRRPRLQPPEPVPHAAGARFERLARHDQQPLAPVRRSGPHGTGAALGRQVHPVRGVPLPDDRGDHELPAHREPQQQGRGAGQREVRGEDDVVGADGGPALDRDPGTGALPDLGDPGVLVDPHAARGQVLGQGEQEAARMELELVVHPHGRRHRVGKPGLGHRGGPQPGRRGGRRLRADPPRGPPVERVRVRRPVLDPGVGAELRADPHHLVEGVPLGPGVPGRRLRAVLPAQAVVAQPVQGGQFAGGVAGDPRRDPAGLQHHHPAPGQGQSAGGAQTGDPRAHDDHVGVEVAGEGRTGGAGRCRLHPVRAVVSRHDASFPRFLSAAGSLRDYPAPPR
ncbi:hypothetical protein ACVW0K_000672 [Streptomyces filamentosus]